MYFTFTGNDGACAGADGGARRPRGRAPRRALRRRWATCWPALLADALGDHPHVVDLRGRGLFRGIELTTAERRSVRRPAVVRECLARDVWVYPAGSGPVDDAVMIGCPFTISEAELELLVDVLRTAIDAAAAAG